MPIRPANVADIPAILTLDRDSVTAAHYSEKQYAGIVCQTSALDAPADSARPLALVIEEDSQIKAFLIGQAVATEWEIENVVVAGNARRKGLATQLVQNFLEMACHRGAHKVFLEVRESNQAARRLYEKLLFVMTGRRRNYYRDPDEDAVLYARELSGDTQ